MGNTLFTADLHIGHRLVGGTRGFGALVSAPGERVRYEGVDSDAHDELVRANWCEAVRADDLVWVLGDLAVSNGVDAIMAMLAFVDSLPGRKRLILGNHDLRHPMHRDKYARWVKPYAEVFETVDTMARIKIAGRDAMLSHFPYNADERHLLEHDGADKHAAYRLADSGLWLLHGHTHSIEARDQGPREINVGLDAWGMKPVAQQEIERIILAA